MTVSIAPSFSLGPFRVEPSLNRVSSPSSSQRVTPKAMEVLVLLASRPGETVTRDAFLDAVWRDVSVGEEVLTRAIADLRKVLEDDPRAPTYIATIPKRGYRLVAPVTPLPEPVAAPSAARRSNLLWLATFALLGLALLATWLVRVRARPSLDSAAPQLLETTPLTSFPGAELMPAVSPDATRVAFVWHGETRGNWDIYVKARDADSASRLTDSPAVEASPSWSRDGSRVAYMRYAEGACGIFEVAATGGDERRLGSCGRSQNPDLTRSPDGRLLAFSDRERGDESFGIFLLDVETGERRKLSAPDGQHWGDKDPSFSPDSAWVAFTRSVSMRTQDVFRIRVDGTDLRRVSNDGREVRGHTYTPDGGALVVASARNGHRALWRFPLDGGAPSSLVYSGGSPAAPEVNARGEVVFEDRASDSDILAADLAPSGDREARALARSTREDREPALSPNGERLAFVSARSGFTEIWVSDSAGEAPRRLTHFDGPHVGAPSWSRDGERIAFDARPEGHADVFVVDADGGELHRITTEPTNELAPSFALDGASLFFGSDRGGSWEIWRVPLRPPGARAERVTRDGGYAPRVAPDGRGLYVSKYDRPGLFRLDLDTGEETPVMGLETLNDPTGWDFHDGGLIALLFDGNAARLLAIDPASGTTTELGELPAQSGGGLVLDRERGRVLFTQAVMGESDLLMAALELAVERAR